MDVIGEGIEKPVQKECKQTGKIRIIRTELSLNRSANDTRMRVCALTCKSMDLCLHVCKSGQFFLACAMRRLIRLTSASLSLGVLSMVINSPRALVTPLCPIDIFWLSLVEYFWRWVHLCGVYFCLCGCSPVWDFSHLRSEVLDAAWCISLDRDACLQSMHLQITL